MIDWTKPIETVPDKRNPEPVPCEFKGKITCSDYEVYIRGDWYADETSNQRDDDDVQEGWFYGEDGDPHYDRLPLIRNVRNVK